MARSNYKEITETTNLIDLKIEALSYSNVLRKFKASDYRLIKWKPIPLIKIDPNINIITTLQNLSREIINLDLDLNIPPIAKSSLLALKLKEGSELTLNNEVIMPENKIDSDEYYYLNFNQNSQIVRLQIRNPDIFNGLYEGEISIYSSVKDDLNKSYLEHSIFEDVKNKLTTKNEKNILVGKFLKWHLVQNLIQII